MDYMDFVQGGDTSVLGLSREEAVKKPYIASMGIYVFRRDVLLNLLEGVQDMDRNSDRFYIRDDIIIIPKNSSNGMII
ncbi:Glucose-1-phosphate adenylyltransferase large subunit 1 [Carex littledalei]|uniref:Glucose-1-phosphate adenylyltransferase large subunit 1 n=1 Tax=Carex littledalei TaxID=544730 RepID=A0A833RQH6_9POAL|nr:Glucose-1-phosphate adenylyltransferase large subunit 1 [Carex littledalei]